jgi:hypothetical protein
VAIGERIASKRNSDGKVGGLTAPCFTPKNHHDTIWFNMILILICLIHSDTF